MRSKPAAFVAELAQGPGHGGLIHLLEIESTPPIYRCTGGQDVTFTPAGASAARTYIADDLRFGEIRATNDLESPLLEVRLQNVRHPVTGAARPWSTEINQTNFNGVGVNFRLVARALLADGNAQIEDEGWRISGAVLDKNDVVFPVGPPHNIFVLETARPTLKKPRCDSEYKDGFCKSASTLPTCPKNLPACMARHPHLALRFSQYPYHDQSLRRRRA